MKKGARACVLHNLEANCTAARLAVVRPAAVRFGWAASLAPWCAWRATSLCLDMHIEAAALCLLAREVDFAASKIRVAPNSESAWNYLRGQARLAGAPARAAAADDRWRRACEEALARQPSCAHALALLADVYAEQAAMLERAAAATPGAGDANAAQRRERLARAAALARRLAGELLGKLAVADPTRVGYYHYRAASLKQQQEATAAAD
jgi:hypothetical protein